MLLEESSTRVHPSRVDKLEFVKFRFEVCEKEIYA